MRICCPLVFIVRPSVHVSATTHRSVQRRPPMMMIAFPALTCDLIFIFSPYESSRTCFNTLRESISLSRAVAETRGDRPAPACVIDERFRQEQRQCHVGHWSLVVGRWSRVVRRWSRVVRRWSRVVWSDGGWWVAGAHGSSSRSVFGTLVLLTFERW